jgi:hypothetical protein
MCGVEFQEMTTAPLPPFSARNRREKVWIEEDFPGSARTGLLHLLNYAVEMNYLSGWPGVARELGRIARVPPRDYDASSVQSIEKARFDAEDNLKVLDWNRIYDFCERLHSHLAQGASYYHNDEVVTITKAQSQLFFAEEMQRLFEEENLGYEFRDGLVQRRGKRHTINQINKAKGLWLTRDCRLPENIFQNPFAIFVIVRNLTLKIR